MHTRTHSHESNLKRSNHQQHSLSNRKLLMRSILALMSDGVERSSYEIAATIAPDSWWNIAAVLEQDVFHSVSMLAPLGEVAENRLSNDSHFEARHDGHCWLYKIKLGLFS